MSEPTSNGLEWDHRPELRHPVFVAGFEGWNDAADAASDAAAWLTRHHEADRFAWIDPEEHFDFQSQRPVVQLMDGVTRTITWPANAAFAVRIEDAPHDLVVVRGVEPNLRWRSFCRAVLEVAKQTRCELLVTFGALLADVPHTRPIRITGAATDADLVSRLRLQHSRYEGPTGIVGVLHDAARLAGLPSASLWAPVPHYVAAPPNPVATRALLDRFGELIGAPLDLGELDELADTWRRRVDDVVAGDDDVRAYVGQLEERHDAEPPDLADIPSGDTLAAELERFLREQRGDPGD